MKLSRNVGKFVTFDPDTLDRIEDYMKINSSNFTESVRRIIKEYFANQEAPVFSMMESIQESEQPPGADQDIEPVTPSEQPPGADQDIDNTPQNDKNKGFNWNDVDLG